VKIKKEKLNNISKYSLIGRLDSNTKDIYEKEVLEDFSETNNKVIIDFGELDYISSAGLRMLLMSAKTIKKSNGKIVLFAMKDFIKEVFDMAGFTPLFIIMQTQKDAIAEF